MTGPGCFRDSLLAVAAVATAIGARSFSAEASARTKKQCTKYSAIYHYYYYNLQLLLRVLLLPTTTTTTTTPYYTATTTTYSPTYDYCALFYH